MNKDRQIGQISEETSESTERPLLAPETKKEKTFIYLGSDHEVRVDEQLVKVLREYPVDAITLEERLDLTRIKDRLYDYPSGKERLLAKDGTPFIVTRSDEIKTTLVASGLYVYGHPRSNNHPESNTGIRYAIGNKLPFYFIERTSAFGDAIFEFYRGKLKVHSLEGKMTYQNYPDTRNLDEFAFSVPARNRFSSDALNFLFNECNCIAHIGGIGHFDSSFKLDRNNIFSEFITPLPSRDLELQNLVHSQKKFGFNLVTNTPFSKT